MNKEKNKRRDHKHPAPPCFSIYTNTHTHIHTSAAREPHWQSLCKICMVAGRYVRRAAAAHKSQDTSCPKAPATWNADSLAPSQLACVFPLPLSIFGLVLTDAIFYMLRVWVLGSSMYVIMLRSVVCGSVRLRLRRSPLGILIMIIFVAAQRKAIDQCLYVLTMIEAFFLPLSIFLSSSSAQAFVLWKMHDCRLRWNVFSSRPDRAKPGF